MTSRVVYFFFSLVSFLFFLLFVLNRHVTPTAHPRTDTNSPSYTPLVDIYTRTYTHTHPCFSSIPVVYSLSDLVTPSYFSNIRTLSRSLDLLIFIKSFLWYYTLQHCSNDDVLLFLLRADRELRTVVLGGRGPRVNLWILRARLLCKSAYPQPPTCGR